MVWLPLANAAGAIIETSIEIAISFFIIASFLLVVVGCSKNFERCAFSITNFFGRKQFLKDTLHETERRGSDSFFNDPNSPWIFLREIMPALTCRKAFLKIT